MERALIVYSNPADTDRIRLDKEHRALDSVLAGLGLPSDTIVRRHATTFNDLCSVVAEDQFSLFQFSGHGTPTGVYLESDSADRAEFASASSLATLLSQSQPTLKVAVFMSCFSAESIPTLLTCAPYLLTVFGPVKDDLAIAFQSEFYRRYFHDQSIARACFFAQEAVRGRVNLVVSRRAKETLPHTPLFEVFPRGDHFGDSFLVDLLEAEQDIITLGASREQFLDSLTRKVRLHHRIFTSARENVFLPVGPFIGVFSWRNSTDRIVCHRILKMRADTDQEASDAWASLAVTYNDDAGLRYRLQDQPAAPHNEQFLKSALKSYQQTFSSLCASGKYVKYATVLPKLVPDQYLLATSVIRANLEKAEQKLDSATLGDVVYHLECVLSAVHDLLNALTDAVTEKTR